VQELASVPDTVQRVTMTMDPTTPTSFTQNSWGTKTNKYLQEKPFVRSVVPEDSATQQDLISKLCTPEEYLNLRPDVRAARIPAMQHYKLHGFKEGMCK